ncbi:MAG: hypothetical protein WAU31_03470, partial [Candidatus Moraniibacteriota bacterium]
MKFLIIPIGVFLGIAWAFSLFFSSASAVYASDAPCGSGGGILGYAYCCRDAKICPDGTVLGRTLPMCIFPECPGSGGGGTPSNTCGPAAKNYAYTDTSFSGRFCLPGYNAYPNSGSSISFPAPGGSVTWRCSDGGPPTPDCTATRGAAPSITCGTANGQTYSPAGPPGSTPGAICSSGSATIFARTSGGYWNGWSWSCGSNSCSANLSPGVCGSANGTTRTTAPSTV